MAGRGDNNKSGSSGRGAGNQSMQGAKGGKQETAAQGEKTGGQPSEPQKKERDQSANRNTPTETGQA